ncbi:GDSL-type esterase/lipase family protein [Natronolimnobius baerhuensis]|uniref:GDSL family lipase n=1 Tax=Natronolimnobius baerhuensis TaxID=253108 RepID=A0A202EAC4_9EURY|nr:GDSL-type esterase/lipase family protein [Natronolimnobius baerhuensis]OVE84920.1 GDSL family lipase [Natronolimnobius baerhuensis]
MHSSRYPSVSLHNVAALETAPWADDGQQLLRLPSNVREQLNVSARTRARHPAGCELRFVPSRDECSITVTLSAATGTRVLPYWGPFQSTESIPVGPEPTTATFAVPDRVRRLETESISSAFDPRVCRLRFDPESPIAIHAVTGDCRPPRAGELPARRYLAYGTSITAGYGSQPHCSYVAQAARHLALDPINLGLAGAAFCEPAIADYLAAREDWDVATLSLSVNMANRGFTQEQFRERADNLVETVANAHPETPIACITLFPYHADHVRGDDRDRAAAFRQHLRDIVAETDHDELVLLEGPDLLEPTGLTTDLLHPGDEGLIDIGRALAGELDGILE